MEQEKTIINGQRHRITITNHNKVVLHPDTFCPMKSLIITVGVCSEAQHDGHPWTDEDVKCAEADLVDKIMEDLKVQVNKFVENLNPFGMHKCGIL